MIGNWLDWQINYLLALQNFRSVTNNIFDNFFLNITVLGEITTPIILGCLIYWSINKKTGIYIFWNFLFGIMINTILKMTACIYRPWFLSSKIHPVTQAMPTAWGYSFPSGHSSNVMAFFGSSAIKFWNNSLLRYLFITIVFLVMFSRNYLGVHTPQDVIVSFIVMLGVLYYSDKLMNWENKTKNGDIIIAGGITIISTLIILYISLKSYPIDYINGKVLYDPATTIQKNISYFGIIYGYFYGWLIEKRFIKFSTENIVLWKRILRFTIGISILMTLMNYVQPVFVSADSTLDGFIFNMILGLYISTIYPYFIKKLKI